MTEKDLERIGQLIDSRLELMESRLNARFEQIDARFEQIDVRFDQVEARLTNLESFKSEIISEFNHSLDIKAEEFFRQFQVAAEGYAALAEREERLEERVKEDEAKVEHLYLEFLMHHLDLEVHNLPSGYRVKEDEAGFGHPDPFHQFDPEFRKRLVEAKKRLDAAADEVLAYCAEKGIELPTGNTEAMICLIRESAKHKVEQELKKRSEEEQTP